MPIPKEILAVERPKNTVVRKSGERYLVIKRTCRRVGKRNLPVDLGTIGEIVNGAYIEKRKEPRKRRIDVKDYGEVALCDKAGRDSPAAHLSEYKEATVLYRKERMADGKYLYSFRNPRIASEQETAYIQNATKKGNFSEQAYADRKAGFGLVVFKSKSDLEPLALYLAYAQRWVIEVLFNMFKNIIDRDTVNVHGDYRTYATELVNFLSAVIASRVKNMVVKSELNKRYSFRQMFKYLAKYKKVRTSEDGP